MMQESGVWLSLRALTPGISTWPGVRFNPFLSIRLFKACIYIQFLFHADKVHHIYSRGTGEKKPTC